MSPHHSPPTPLQVRAHTCHWSSRGLNPAPPLPEGTLHSVHKGWNRPSPSPSEAFVCQEIRRETQLLPGQGDDSEAGGALPELGAQGRGRWGQWASGGGPHHAVQLLLQLPVDPLQRHVVALNPGTGGKGATSAPGLALPSPPPATRSAEQGQAEQRPPSPPAGPALV